ncbi:MAG: hypothetical protein HUK22_00665, partial [Thermoguttaceae bacterium]|nr:hypothetical protein [Thermoguttaceae bacterium]
LESCARRGYVETLCGRRRAIVGVRGARGRSQLNFPERAAINAVVQGSAADLMKLATLAVWRRLRRDGWFAAAAEPAFRSALSLDFGSTPLFAAAFGASEERAVADAGGGAAAGGSRARLLLQIHDELLFETRRADADELARVVVEEMTLGQPLRAPLQVDAAIGANWGEI